MSLFISILIYSLIPFVLLSIFFSMERSYSVKLSLHKRRFVFPSSIFLPPFINFRRGYEKLEIYRDDVAWIFLLLSIFLFLLLVIPISIQLNVIEFLNLDMTYTFLIFVTGLVLLQVLPIIESLFKPSHLEYLQVKQNVLSLLGDYLVLVVCCSVLLISYSTISLRVIAETTTPFSFLITQPVVTFAMIFIIIKSINNLNNSEFSYSRLNLKEFSARIYIVLIAVALSTMIKGNAIAFLLSRFELNHIIILVLESSLLLLLYCLILSFSFRLSSYFPKVDCNDYSRLIGVVIVPLLILNVLIRLFGEYYDVIG